MINILGKNKLQADSDDEMEEDEIKLEDKEANRKRRLSRIEEANMTRQDLMAKKMKLKAKFDADYDEDGGKAGAKENSHRVTGDDAFYDNLKAEAQRQTDLNRKEFASLDEDTRLQIEGYRAGLYVRMNFTNLPCEFVENFDPTYPMLIGGLNMAEENVGYVSCKVSYLFYTFNYSIKSCYLRL